jgi:hypothetical protein
MRALGKGARLAAFERRGQRAVNDEKGRQRSKANKRAPAWGSIEPSHAFREGLGERGVFEGKNVMIEYRWAEGQYGAISGSPSIPMPAKPPFERPISVTSGTAAK